MDSSSSLLMATTPETNETQNDTEHLIPFCKQILYEQVNVGSVRVWDVAILTPNLLFMVFLLYKFKRIKAKLAASKSPVYKAFYFLVYAATVVNIARCVVSIALTSANSAEDYIAKILWLALRFCLLSAELCVLSFGLLFGHLDSRTSIRRVLAATVLVSLLFSSAQSLLEFLLTDSPYRSRSSSLTPFSHGGMYFWLITSSIFLLIYVTVCLLPVTSLKQRLPKKPSFYVYCGLLAILNSLQVGGTAMILHGNLLGMCVVDLTSYVYFAFYTPLVYLCFLRGLLATRKVPFRYHLQKDEAGAGELGDSGTFYYPGLPGITSPSYDDILHSPDFYDSTDLNSPTSGAFEIHDQEPRSDIA